MTSPIEDIDIKCPKCGFEYKDWYRASINLQLDNFDKEYIEDSSTAKCPKCGYIVAIDTLVVDENGNFSI